MLAALTNSARKARTAQAAPLATGIVRLDRLLDGGFPRAAVTEILPAAEGRGEVEMILPALAELGSTCWILPVLGSFEPFAPALEGAVPVPDAEVAPKREASPVSSGEEKVAEPVPAPEDPREQIRLRAVRLREALATLEKYLETDSAGFWEASPDDRVAYVRYVEPVLAVWRLAGDWLGAPPKRRPPLDPHLYDWDDMTPGLAWAAFSELVGLERMETGAFLRAANSGLVGRLLRRILDASPEAWFGEGSSSRTPIA